MLIAIDTSSAFSYSEKQTGIDEFCQ